MIAVIFTAEVGELPQQYYDLAAKVRLLANDYGCIDFISVAENGKEISISYWDSQDQILKWRQDPIHLQAQKLGREQWYQSYKVQVTEVMREYNHNKA